MALAEDKQASNIVLLDLRRLNSVADYFVICTGGSERQLKAITEAIDEGLAREYDIQPRIEGTADTGWVLLDYGDVVVHIFLSNCATGTGSNGCGAKRPRLSFCNRISI